MSNVGKWDDWYRSATTPAPFGDSDSYKMGADYLQDCDTVEDWGCGQGWFSRHRPDGCIGVDGSHSPFAARIADLEQYRSSVDGIFMRHVLEHNYQWKSVLGNAIASFTRKFVLVIFTPWSDGETREMRFIERVGVPDLAFRKDDITEMLQGLDWELVELQSPLTIYGQEHLFLVRRPGPQA